MFNCLQYTQVGICTFGKLWQLQPCYLCLVSKEHTALKHQRHISNPTVPLCVYFNFVSKIKVIFSNLISIHSSMFCLLSVGSRLSKSRRPTPQQCLQLLLGDPKAFSSQIRYIKSPECSGSTQGFPISRMCLENLKGRRLGGILIRCPNRLHRRPSTQRSVSLPGASSACQNSLHYL